MAFVCAWCNQVIGDDMEPGGNKYNITKGMCEDCSIRLGAKSQHYLHDFIEKFKQPVFVVDKDMIVCTSNQSGSITLNKSLLSIEGRLGGDVIECIHAGEPGGCGRTVHCVACTIRKSINQTFETGMGVSHLPAYQITSSPQGPLKMKFEISTEKVNNIILLQIDSLEPQEDTEKQIADLVK